MQYICAALTFDVRGISMALTRIVIDGFKSIEHCDISLSEMNIFLGENGSGKTNLLEAISETIPNFV